MFKTFTLLIAGVLSWSVVAVARPKPKVEKPDKSGQACFYAKANFEGRRFCMKVGTQMRNVGSSDDPINSISIHGPLLVTVYNHANFSGGGVTLIESVANVGNLPSITNVVSSIAIIPK